MRKHIRINPLPKKEVKILDEIYKMIEQVDEITAMLLKDYNNITEDKISEFANKINQMVHIINKVSLLILSLPSARISEDEFDQIFDLFKEYTRDLENQRRPVDDFQEVELKEPYATIIESAKHIVKSYYDLYFAIFYSRNKELSGSVSREIDEYGDSVSEYVDNVFFILYSNEDKDDDDDYENHITYVNVGVLTPEEEHNLDIKLSQIFDRVYMLDPQPNYQLTQNEKGETIIECENGFELYVNALEEMGY